MKKKYIFVIIMLAGILVVGSSATSIYLRMETKTEDRKNFTIVTSFYPMYIAAMNIIGETDGVTLVNLSEPKTGCLHDYQLTPEDMKLLSAADVFIVNGGGIESFLSDVAENYPGLTIIEACDGLSLEEDNAHAWMSIEMYKNQLENITEGLAAMEADQQRIQGYKTNMEAYKKKLESLQAQEEQIKYMLQGQNVVLFHEAYEYLAEELGFDTVYVMDLDEERQISAGEVSELFDAIESENVSYVLAEELYGKDMGEMTKQQTGVTVLYLDTLVRGEYDPDSYLTAMQENLQKLVDAAQSLQE